MDDQKNNEQIDSTFPFNEFEEFSLNDLNLEKKQSDFLEDMKIKLEK